MRQVTSNPRHVAGRLSGSPQKPPPCAGWRPSRRAGPHQRQGLKPMSSNRHCASWPCPTRERPMGEGRRPAPAGEHFQQQVQALRRPRSPGGFGGQARRSTHVRSLRPGEAARSGRPLGGGPAGAGGQSLPSTRGRRRPVVSASPQASRPRQQGCWPNPLRARRLWQAWGWRVFLWQSPGQLGPPGAGRLLQHVAFFQQARAACSSSSTASPPSKPQASAGRPWGRWRQRTVSIALPACAGRWRSKWVWLQIAPGSRARPRSVCERLGQDRPLSARGGGQAGAASYRPGARRPAEVP